MAVQALLPIYLEGSKRLITNCTSLLYFRPNDYGVERRPSQPPITGAAPQNVRAHFT